MMIFKNPAFGEIRTIRDTNNNPWFVGKDVATILGYKDPKRGIYDHVDDEDKRGCEINTPGGRQPLTVINESGLYSLILSSKLPQAKAFKRWVTSEVLPAIRKDGGYIATMKDDTPEEIMARALLIASWTACPWRTTGTAVSQSSPWSKSSFKPTAAKSITATSTSSGSPKKRNNPHQLPELVGIFLST